MIAPDIIIDGTEELEEQSLVQDNDLPDAVRLYLRDISRYNLLSREEERRLAILVKQGDSDARAQLINANLRLVVSIARKFIGARASLLDLIQEGNIGLMKAIEKFDCSRGYKFSTYATWWIRQAMSRWLEENARLIRLPSGAHTQLRQIKQLREQHFEDHGCEPSLAWIAKQMVLKTPSLKGMAPERVGELLRGSLDVTSLDTPLFPFESDDHTTIADAIPDQSIDVEASVSNTDLKERITVVLQSLTQREQQVLRMRFGLDTNAGSLEVVVVELGITRERVRQLQAAALRKLRQNKESSCVLSGGN